MNIVDLDLLHALYHGAQQAGCVYVFGAKPAVTADSHTVKESDCSGMSRWLLARTTGQDIIQQGFPDGSLAQRDWCAQRGLHRVDPYSNLHFAASDPKRLFIAFETGHPVGHVWLVNGGRTLEAHGPRGSELAGRAWDNSILVRIVTDCWELPAK